MDEKGLLEALSSGKYERCTPYIDEVLAHPSSLRPYFESLLRHTFVQSAASNHPVIPVNAIKNISSLREDSPARLLVEFATRTALKAEPPEQSVEWPELPPEAANQPVFVADMFHALQNGDLEKVLEEAALLALISDNKLYVVELLMEASTRRFETLGLLGYSVFRAAAFCQKSDIRPFMIPLIRRAVTERIEHIRISEPGEFDLEGYAWSVLNHGDLEDVVLYGISHRLWNLDSVKQSAFRGGIALWLAEKFGIPGESPPVKMPDDEPGNGHFLSVWERGEPEALGAYFKTVRANGELTWALDLGEHWLKKGIPVNPVHFVVLDCLHHLVKVVPDTSVVPLANIVFSLPSGAVE